VPRTRVASGVVHSVVSQKRQRSGDIARRFVSNDLGAAEGVVLAHPLAVGGHGEVYCIWFRPQERT
jgi:hypothetical protein